MHIYEKKSTKKGGGKNNKENHKKKKLFFIGAGQQRIKGKEHLVLSLTLPMILLMNLDVEFDYLAVVLENRHFLPMEFLTKTNCLQIRRPM